MLWAGLAKLVLIVHLAFVVFVVLGGLLAIRWPRAAWVHLPAAVWGVWIELSGRVCPLTPLENRLLLEAGERGYAGSFVERYLLSVLYPSGLTARDQLGLGLIVLGANLIIYGAVALRRQRARRHQ